MTEPYSLGANIAQLRRNAKLTQAALADRIGVTAQAVSQWERSETMPDILTLPMLAEVFSCSIDALFHAEKQKSPNDNAWRAVIMHGDQVVDQKDIPANITKKITLEIHGAVAGDVYSDLPVIIHGAVSGKLQSNSIITIDNTAADIEQKHVHISVGKSKNKPMFITLPEKLEEDYVAVLMRGGKIVETAKLPDINERVELHINGNAGDVQSAFSVTVDGDVEGDVTCTEANIEGSVEGDVSANTVTVYGDIDGDIDADTVLRG